MDIDERWTDGWTFSLHYEAALSGKKQLCYYRVLHREWL